MNNKQRQLPNRKKMRNAVTLLIALALAVSSVGTAAAKKGKPSSDPIYYNVAMERVNSSDGLSTNTTCGADPLVMRLEESRSGSLLATADGSFPSDPVTSEPNLYLKAVFDKLAFNDCYYGTNPDSAVTGPGFFRIIFDRTGAIEKITWHFDNEAVMRPRKHGKGELFVVLHKHALTSQTVEVDR